MIPIEQITILFVDDEPDILNALKRFLKREEYVAEFVSGGLEAVERLKRGDINILVTDMQMPGMDGTQLVQYAKEHYPSIVRMVLSANTNFEQTMASINSGEIFRYIIKPLNPKLFRSILHDAVEYYRMAQLWETVTAEGTPELTTTLPELESSCGDRPVKPETATGTVPTDQGQQVSHLIENEYEKQVRLELLRTGQPQQETHIEVVTVTESSQAINTVFSDCLVTASDCTDILLGNIITDSNRSPLLGLGFKNIILKAVIQSYSDNTRRGAEAADLADLVGDIDRETLPKLRALGLSMNMLYSRYNKNNLHYIDCGKINIFHYQGATGSYAVHKGGNPPLGLLEGTGYNTRSLALAPGDILLFFLHTTPLDGVQLEWQISDGKIAETVQEFAELEVRPPLYELGPRLLNNPEGGEQDSNLTCLALRVPEQATSYKYTAESGLQGATSG
ncbi:response regulator [Desulfosediminicola sp.]|uniref:response regulator n=1 Tax=Desulfosediminicola sp. TaxID=2886825 RepID=UPI003AF2387F